MTTRRCESCPSGTQFRDESKKCVQVSPRYLTNPNTAKNLILDKDPLSMWRIWYNQNKTAYPEARDCEEPTPYYNGYTCISCRNEFPYFDMNMLDCVRCPNGYHFNSNGQCINSEASSKSPNLASMAATAFTHDVQAPIPRHTLRRTVS